MKASAIDQSKLAKISILRDGEHRSADEGFSVMEAVAFVAGEPWSDHPDCACPVISSFLRSWNDSISTDELRTRLLLPLIPQLVGTKANAAVQERRSLKAADWLVRKHTPAWLRLAGLDEQAQLLEGLPEITSMERVPSIRERIEAVRRDAVVARAPARAAVRDAARAVAGDATGTAARSAYGDVAGSAAWTAVRAAAWDAAGDAAWTAARDAAWDAAGAAAGDAAWTAAWTAAREVAGATTGATAWTAAWTAAGDAAWDAAWDALRPTVETLQESALRLVQRMIAVTPESIEPTR